jgi:thiol-disulfide isomerase/thioredoxin
MLNTMKTRGKELLSLIVVTILAMTILNTFRSPKLDDDRLPQFDVSLIDGSTFNHKTIQGQPLVIYFWGSWCGVCDFQSPVIEALSEETEVLSIAVNSGDQTRLSKLMKTKGHTFRTINDRQRQWSTLFQVNIFPTIFIYDAQGQLRFTEVGYTSTIGLKMRLAWLNLW